MKDNKLIEAEKIAFTSDRGDGLTIDYRCGNCGYDDSIHLEDNFCSKCGAKFTVIVKEEDRNYKDELIKLIFHTPVSSYDGKTKEELIADLVLNSGYCKCNPKEIFDKIEKAIVIDEDDIFNCCGIKLIKVKTVLANIAEVREKYDTGCYHKQNELLKEAFEKINDIFRNYYTECSKPSDTKLRELLQQGERFVVNEMWHEVSELEKTYLGDKKHDS